MNYIDTIKNLNLNTIYLAPYSSNLAAVELFIKILKTKIRRSILNTDIRINEIKGRA